MTERKLFVVDIDVEGAHAKTVQNNLGPDWKMLRFGQSLDGRQFDFILVSWPTVDMTEVKTQHVRQYVAALRTKLSREGAMVLL